ncbi:hypothetical protein HAX54_048261 [Datura stramonium]|uniref:RNase H type-1 domain-containing protein n=1 Tax=Datura stramonium TaxID=4076 RepID=A0ABS8WL05_DATST|nr:hypothetical protein [Datura stramonium]
MKKSNGGQPPSAGFSGNDFPSLPNNNKDQSKESESPKNYAETIKEKQTECNKYDALREEDDNNDSINQNNNQLIQEIEVHNNCSPQEATSHIAKETKEETAKEWIERSFGKLLQAKSKEEVNKKTQFAVHKSQHSGEKPVENSAINIRGETAETDESQVKRSSTIKVLHDIVSNTIEQMSDEKEISKEKEGEEEQHRADLSPKANKAGKREKKSDMEDGASKGNLGPSYASFCVRNKDENVVGAKGRRLSITTDIIAEATAIKEGLGFCIQRHFFIIIVETDSLAMVNIINGIWEIPWCVTMEATL